MSGAAATDGPGAVPAPGGRVAVHLVVVSYRTPALLHRCLAAAAADHAAGRLVATVVDNAPGDGSVELVRERHPWVRLVEPGRNLGFGAAVDAGAAGVAADWVAPANADVALRPGALDALLDAGTRDAGAGVLAPRLVTPDGTAQHSVHPFPGVRFTTAYNAGVVGASARLSRRFVLHGAWDADEARRVPWAHGALLLVRRAAWDAIGGFDPRMWMYAEDLDLCWRATRAGWGVRYVPGAPVDHEVAAATGARWGTTRDRRGMAATYAWLRARRGRGVAGTVAAANVAGAAARSVLPGPGRGAARGWLRAHLGALRDLWRDDGPGGAGTGAR